MVIFVTCAKVEGQLVAVTIKGVTDTVVLQNNSTDDLTITADGLYNFATRVKEGQPYKVQVSKSPAGVYCSIGNQSGAVATKPISVTVTCSAPVVITLLQFQMNNAQDLRWGVFVGENFSELKTPAGKSVCLTSDLKTDGTDFYVAGVCKESKSSTTAAFGYWKNAGDFVELTGGSSQVTNGAFGSPQIYVHNGKVYLTKSRDNDGGTAGYWVDSDYVSLRDDLLGKGNLAFNGNDIYHAAYIQKSESVNSMGYYLNDTYVGIEVNLAEVGIRDLKVIDGSVYIFGTRRVFTTSEFEIGYWKDGSWQALPYSGVASNIYLLDVKNLDGQYILGSITYSSSSYIYWKGLSFSSPTTILTSLDNCPSGVSIGRAFSYLGTNSYAPASCGSTSARSWGYFENSTYKSLPSTPITAQNTLVSNLALIAK